MFIYETIQGDTWDFIAYKVYKQYGAGNLFDILIDYNPEYIDYVIFPAGIKLIIPEINEPVIENLPPWKR